MFQKLSYIHQFKIIIYPSGNFVQNNKWLSGEFIYSDYSKVTLTQSILVMTSLSSCHPRTTYIQFMFLKCEQPRFGIIIGLCCSIHNSGTSGTCSWLFILQLKVHKSICLKIVFIFSVFICKYVYCSNVTFAIKFLPLL